MEQERKLQSPGSPVTQFGRPHPDGYRAGLGLTGKIAHVRMYVRDLRTSGQSLDSNLLSGEGEGVTLFAGCTNLCE